MECGRINQWFCGSSSGTIEFSHANSTALCLLVNTQRHICANRIHHSLGWCEACGRWYSFHIANIDKVYQMLQLYVVYNLINIMSFTGQRRYSAFVLIPYIYVCFQCFCQYCILTHWGRDKMVAISETTLNENVWNSIEISLKFVPKNLIDNKRASVRTMAWHDQATSHYLNQWWLSLQTHICVTQPQWVNLYAQVFLCNHLKFETHYQDQ